jgi:hypothetical protein
MERKILGAFACCLLVVAAVPAYGQSDCADAVTIPWPGAADLDPCTDTNPTGYATYGACTSGGGVNDVWAKFIATDTRVRIRTDVGSTGTDSDYTVYYWDGGGVDECDTNNWYFTNGGCSEDEVGYLGDIIVSDLVVGGTYFIALGGWADTCGPFHLAIEDAPPVPTLPQWGLLGLGVLLLGGGAVVFGRLRFVA